MNIVFFDTIDSTNTYAKKNILDLPDKTVISAACQTAGRGRFKRSWADVGSENIYMTLVLKPSDSFSEKYANLTQYLSVVLAKKLEKMGLNPKIKWPNDVLINGKKVAGILAETVFSGDQFKGIVLGIGINLNAEHDLLSKIDRPATALNLELGSNIDKKLFMEELLGSFSDGYDEFLEHGFCAVKADYEDFACFLNETITIAVFKKTIKGYSKGIDENGALLLQDENGKIHSLNMGEII